MQIEDACLFLEGWSGIPGNDLRANLGLERKGT